MKKHQFRKLVKSKTSYAAFKYLQNMQQGHSKMKLIKYEKFELTPYLNSPVFNNSNRILLLALRTRTVRGIRSDFGGLYLDKMCPLGCGDIDNLENILSCRVLRQHHKSNEISHTDIRYQDVFSADISKQQKVTEMYNQLLEIRNTIIRASCW